MPLGWAGCAARLGRGCNRTMLVTGAGPLAPCPARYLPDADYVAALLRRQQEQMRVAGEASLGQALWALSVWQVLPSDEWIAAWWVAA